MDFRLEHPRPQFERDDWIPLNGVWDFEMYPGISEEYPNWENADGLTFTKKINVPFCPESKLSGIQFTDYLAQVHYRRTVDIPKDKLNGRVLIHFGAVDYQCKLFVNGAFAGTHRGGYSSFDFDITEHCKVGSNELILLCWDNVTSDKIPSGKQTPRATSFGCLYTRTTGIWQSVWMEFVPKNYIESAHILTDEITGNVNITAIVHGKGEFTVTAYYDGKEVGYAETYTSGYYANVTVALTELHLWEPGHGRLYDLVFTFGEDTVRSYCGLRSVTYEGMKFIFNSKSLFQRFVLDQGFYPDGIYTAPSEAELVRDIDNAIECGFNGSRLHQKVFEERFLYNCDKRGYMVWGEFGSWNLCTDTEDAAGITLTEWVDIIKRDRNHPCIITWAPYNEMGEKTSPHVMKLIYNVTKSLDPTRPFVDNSGFYHIDTEVYDLHDYEQNVALFKEHYEPFAEGGKLYDQYGRHGHQTYEGQPVSMSEYGGTRIVNNDDETAWGYGDDCKTEEELYERLEGLTNVLLSNSKIHGFCYTQLYDIELEQNGLYYYDRTPKFDTKRLHKIFSAPAKIEGDL